LRAEGNAIEPGLRVGIFENVEEHIHPGFIEALRRHPHLRFGMEAVDVLLLLFEQRHQQLWLCVSGIAAGDKDGVDAGQSLEHISPFLNGRFDGVGIAVVLVHCRIPDRDIEPVAVSDARHFNHHAGGRQRKVRAVWQIVGARRHELDDIGAENRQVANVLVPHVDGPSVIGVGLGAISKLVAADGIVRTAGAFEQIRVNLGSLPREDDGAEQLADAEKESALVRAEDGNPAAVGVASGLQGKALGGQRVVCCGQSGHGLAELARSRTRTGVDGDSAAFGLAADGPVEAAALARLFRKHARRSGFPRGCRAGQHDGHAAQVNPVFRGKRMQPAGLQT